MIELHGGVMGIENEARFCCLEALENFWCQWEVLLFIAWIFPIVWMLILRLILDKFNLQFSALKIIQQHAFFFVGGQEGGMLGFKRN